MQASKNDIILVDRKFELSYDYGECRIKNEITVLYIKTIQGYVHMARKQLEAILKTIGI